MSLRPHILEYLGCGAMIVACEDLRQFVEARVDYPVNGPAVSRVMGNLGWERFVEDGRVHFRQPTKAPA